MIKIFRKRLLEKKTTIRMRLFDSVLIIAVMLSGLIGTSFAGEQSILHFVSSKTPPFWSQTLYQDGLCGEILHQISNEIDVKSVIEYLPTTRMVERIGHNLLGNPEHFLPSHEFIAVIPIAVSRLVFFYYRPRFGKDFTYQRLEGLTGYTIGVMKGSLVDKSFFNSVGIKFEESYSKESLFKKLKLGRIDLCIEIGLSGLLIIKRLFPDEVSNFAPFEIPRSITPITIMINKNCPNGRHLGEKIQKGFRTIINNGKYNAILENYYGRGNIPDDWFELLDRFQKKYDLVLSAS